MQVNFFLPYSKNRSGVPYGFGWGYKGQILELEHKKADIWTLVVLIGNVAGNTFYGRLEVVGVVRLRTVKDKNGKGCIFPLERIFGRDSPTNVSDVWMAEVVPTESSSASTIATTVRQRLLSDT